MIEIFDFFDNILAYFIHAPWYIACLGLIAILGSIVLILHWLYSYNLGGSNV